MEKSNILLVDDVTSNLMTLTDIIREAGYIARPVTDADQAKDAIAAMIPDLILLDVTMPGTDGFSFCKMLKEDVNTRDVPVIFISGLTSSKDKVKGFEAGAVDFITKPFEKAEILVRVANHLKMNTMQRELENYSERLSKLVNRQFFRINEERKNLVNALARIVEMRDNTSGKHLDNVAKNSRILAMGLQLTRKYEKIIPNNFIDTIDVSSRLHDIGSIVVPRDIIFKQSMLTENELEITMTHCKYGARLLSEIYRDNSANLFFKMAMTITACHHEHYDGTGYPSGLAGDDIPIAARIVAVADALDSLLAEKAYKRAMTFDDALRIMNAESGKKFDPDVINIMNKLKRQLCKYDYKETRAMTPEAVEQCLLRR